MTLINSYIYLIVLVKILFIIASITNIYLRFKGKENTDLYIKVVYWKKTLEFIFVILMAILLICLFNITSKSNPVIDQHTKTLLFLFGIMLLTTAKWGIFFKEAVWFKNIQEIIGKEN